MANAIMIALGKAKRPSGHVKLGSHSDEMEEEEEETGLTASEEEIEAAKMMREAKSDEEFAHALKAFIKLCWMQLESEEEEGEGEY